jgi:hypothetical protein
MAQSPAVTTTSPAPPDRLTLIAISALAYLIAVGVHEHLGHTAACILLGSHPLEVGAFYVNCDNSSLSDMRIRLVALAGPLIELALGLACFAVLRRLPRRADAAPYFVWLLGSISLMSSTGYLLFSGLTGLGDFGVSPDGMLYQIEPAWLWQIVLTIVGLVSYVLIIIFSVRAIEPYIGGTGRARIRYARLMALASYLTGAVLYLVIGLLNPYGLIIVVISAAASSLGATAGLLWMMQLLDRKRDVAAPGMVVRRSWRWIALAGVVTIAYAVILGPTLRF